jgi:hypothetical protein
MRGPGSSFAPFYSVCVSQRGGPFFPSVSATPQNVAIFHVDGSILQRMSFWGLEIKDKGIQKEYDSYKH